MESSTLEQFFRDDNGDIVIAQPPNLPLWAWIAASSLKFIWTEGPPHLILDSIATVALVIWAIQELKDGVNGFRRSLGGIVLVLLVLSKVSSL